MRSYFKFEYTIKLKAWLGLLLLAVFLSGCGGRKANPVLVKQPGDGQLSCFALKTEIADLEECMQELAPATNKAGKNVGLGVVGWFLFVPWVFMDFSEAEKKELEAYRQRYNHLARFYNTNRCYASKPLPEMPPFSKNNDNATD